MKKITTILLVNLFIFSLLNNLHSQIQVIEKCGFDRLRNILLQAIGKHWKFLSEVSACWNKYLVSAFWNKYSESPWFLTRIAAIIHVFWDAQTRNAHGGISFRLGFPVTVMPDPFFLTCACPYVLSFACSRHWWSQYETMFCWTKLPWPSVWSGLWPRPIPWPRP